MKVALQHAPTVLDDRSRFIVRKTILDACSYRKWLLHEINVRSNHVHIVVSADAAPERVMNDFKAYATRRLREADAVPPDCRLWSRHGSTRYLWDERAVARACAYVRDGQSSDVLGED
ncbi:MAG TPA: transposase [Phycisphaerae bacterium]|nr:transposase [Phycisphaerae bacterium]HRW53063.1 transposase [Phycisphaerae bacterium]